MLNIYLFDYISEINPNFLILDTKADMIDRRSQICLKNVISSGFITEQMLLAESS